MIKNLLLRGKMIMSIGIIDKIEEISLVVYLKNPKITFYIHNMESFIHFHLFIL